MCAQHQGAATWTPCCLSHDVPVSAHCRSHLLHIFVKKYHVAGATWRTWAKELPEPGRPEAEAGRGGLPGSSSPASRPSPRCVRRSQNGGRAELPRQPRPSRQACARLPDGRRDRAPAGRPRIAVVGGGCPCCPSCPQLEAQWVVLGALRSELRRFTGVCGCRLHSAHLLASPCLTPHPGCDPFLVAAQRHCCSAGPPCSPFEVGTPLVPLS